MSAIIVDDLNLTFSNDPHAAVVCLFCNYKQQAEQDAGKFIATLIKQLLDSDTWTPEDLLQFSKYSSGPLLLYADLVDFYRALIARYRYVFVVIDALDETREDNNIRKDLIPFMESMTNVRLLVTSRHEKAIEGIFQNAGRLEIAGHDEDLRSYVNDRILQEKLIARHTAADPSLHKLIVERVVSNAESMFLMARFYVESLSTKTKRKDIRKALECLPPGLNDCYDEIWRRIQSQPKEYRDLANRVLFWINEEFSVSLKTLQHAVAIEPEMTDIQDDDLDDEEIFLSVCAGPVHVEEETQTVRFIHYTAQEYFEDRYEDLFPDAQKLITTSCVTYLAMDCLGSASSVDGDLSLTEKIENYPFTEFAASALSCFGRGNMELVPLDLLLALLGKTTANVSVARDLPGSRLPLIKAVWTKLGINFEVLIVLHIAAAHGLGHVVDGLLGGALHADVTDDKGMTPLMHVISRQSEEVTTLLLARDDVNVNHKSNNADSPLLLAVDLEATSLVHRIFLSRKDVDVDFKGRGRTALHVAVQRNDVDIVRILLQNGADIEARQVGRPEAAMGEGALQTGWTPLLCALGSCERWDLKYSDGKTNVNAPWAGEKAKALKKTILDLMDDHRANFRVKDDLGQSALHIAAKYQRPEIFEWVLRHEDWEIDAQDEAKSTVLHTVLSSRADAMEIMAKTERLLDLGARTDVTKDRGETPLLLATRNPSVGLNCLEALIQHGASMHAKDMDGWTPLLIMLCKSHFEEFRSAENIRFCLKHGADANVTLNSGLSAVCLGTILQSKLKLRILVEEGHARVNNSPSSTLTPLQICARNAYKDMAQYLLQHGADFDMRARNGQTALDLAMAPWDNGWGEEPSLSSRREMVDILMSYKATKWFVD